MEPAAEASESSKDPYEEAAQLWTSFVEAPRLVSVIQKSCQYRDIDPPRSVLTDYDITSFWYWLICPISEKTLKVGDTLTPYLMFYMAAKNSGVSIDKAHLPDAGKGCLQLNDVFSWWTFFSLMKSAFLLRKLNFVLCL